ncbi:secretin N-terminal domain-containing protein [Planctomycetaceae bacterium SH139]
MALSPVVNAQGTDDQGAVAAEVSASDSFEPAAMPPEPTSQPEPTVDDQVRVRLNFNGTPWKEVLEWFADETGMSLQRSAWPTGTFSYSDPRRSYDISGAIDAMNLVLMREGFALIRRGQLMLLVDTEDDFARDYLRELAEPVTPDELDQRANSDYVRVAFPLGALDAESVVKDLENLRSPSGSVLVLGASRVIVATDTVGVLKSIRDVLLASDAVDGGVMEYQLKNRSAEDVLEVARPHLGLEAGVNTGEDINLSTNLMGDRIFATGDPVKLRILKGLIAKGDIPLPVAEDGTVAPMEAPVLSRYDSGSADPTVALEVLQRLLAGLPDVRLTLDPKTQAIIAQARPSEHQLIRDTLAELGGASSGFKVIQLRRIDPQAALLTINKYFGKTAENTVGPTVDGDPETKKLWVKGTLQEIEEVERLIQELEGGSGSDLLGDRIRILPYTGRSAEAALSQLEGLWQVSGRKNRIRIISSQDLRNSGGQSRGGNIPERRLNQAPPTPPAGNFRRVLPGDAQEAVRGRRPADDAAPDNAPAPRANAQPQGNGQPIDTALEAASEPQEFADKLQRLVSAPLVSQSPSEQVPADQPPAEETPAADTPQGDQPTGDQPTGETPAENTPAKEINSDIIIQVTPQGIIVASDDADALNDFEALMATLADQMALTDDQPTVYWLKYIKADVAAELLNSILGGASSGGGGGGLGGGLLGEIGGGMLGGLMGLGGGGGGGDSGPILTTSGTVSIVPDSRLNALIIQANQSDLSLVEDILQVIDREESPEDVRTTPKPQLIPVIYQNATEVANIVKGVYSDRIAGQAGGQNRQPSPEDFINALRGRGGRGGGGQSDNNKPTPISIAVDTRSNALIVSAPPQDFLDIRELVEVIDQSGMDSEEDVQVITLGGNVKPDVVSNALSAILGPRATTSGTAAQPGATNTNGSGTSGATGASPNDIQQRIEMFRRMREAGGSSRGGSTGGRGGFGGGSPFGGGGSPFGGGSRGGRTGGGR